jgi:hypothetical protein
MMSSTDYKFEGWLGHDPSAAEGKMQWGEYEPKPWEETDVDIKITHCGICGSDLHTLRSGWVSGSSPCVRRTLRGQVANTRPNRGQQSIRAVSGTRLSVLSSV